MLAADARMPGMDSRTSRPSEQPAPLRAPMAVKGNPVKLGKKKQKQTKHGKSDAGRKGFSDAQRGFSRMSESLDTGVSGFDWPDSRRRRRRQKKKKPLQKNVPRKPTKTTEHKNSVKTR